MTRAFAFITLLLLAACTSPYVQPPLMPAVGFSGPRIEQAAFVVEDGARLPYRRWAPEGQPRAVIVALHGMNDHSAAFRLAGPWWAEHQIATYAYDQRGFGAAPGRGTWAGEGQMVGDLRAVVALVRARHPHLPIAVVGESMGGAVAISAFASERPPAADQLILLAPAVWGWSSQSLPNRASLWLAARLLGDRAVEPPDWAVRDIRATDNLIELVTNGNDPRFIRTTRFDTLSGLVDLMESASVRLGQVRVPTLLMYGAHDQIIERVPMRRALDRSGEPANLRTAWYPDGWHLLNRDLQAEVVFGDVAAILGAPDALLPSGAGDVREALNDEIFRR
ncbi:alpha/beta fold hydrolase [Brevundimonas sp. R86498]|uniref:alpha/beta fold hydrolase n=1 Tax=Brevundimonas sp. R86498 TaxID=3093845 RepID=UPI0037C66A94